MLFLLKCSKCRFIVIFVGKKKKKKNTVNKNLYENLICKFVSDCKLY